VENAETIQIRLLEESDPPSIAAAFENMGWKKPETQRCRQAHLLRTEYEAKNPIKASTPSFDEALNDAMPDEVQFRFDFDAGVPWEVASEGGL
jgi:hypothetical protein